MGVGKFINYKNKGGATGDGSAIVSDWPNISNTAGVNEIVMLVGDMSNEFSYKVSLAGAGTFMVDYGTGEPHVQYTATGTSFVTFSKQYVKGSGRPCVEGYTTFIVKIYGATQNIQKHRAGRSGDFGAAQVSPILWIESGVSTLIDINWTTYGDSFPYTVFPWLRKLNMCSQGATLLNVTSAWGFCRDCPDLQFVNIGSQIGPVTNWDSAFQNTGMVDFTMLNFGTASSFSANYMFADGKKMRHLILPASWGGASVVDRMLQNNPSLEYVGLPTAPSSSITSAVAFMNGCTQATADADRITAMFNSSSQINGQNAFQYCEMLLAGQVLTLVGRLSAFDIHGQSYPSAKSRMAGLRLTNQLSTFSGSSPQVNVGYTLFDKTALENLFLDFPSGLPTGKVVSVVSALGSDFISRSMTTTDGSSVVTVSNTTGLSVGMICTGTNVLASHSVTLTDSNDIVTESNHGMIDGTIVSFSAIVGTTGISINTPYYVRNSTPSTFQLSLTPSGSLIDLIGNGTATLRTVPKIKSIIPNVSITLDAVCVGSGATTVTASLLDRTIAIHKGFTVTQ
jgi:hypothetical protein